MNTLFSNNPNNNTGESFVTIPNIPVKSNLSTEEQIAEAWDWLVNNFSEVNFWLSPREVDKPEGTETWNAEEVISSEHQLEDIKHDLCAIPERRAYSSSFIIP